jgi:hypothetical protein
MPLISPTLSIVMPTRNQAAYLPQAVASVLRQAEGPATDLELVVTDGASSDGTPDLLAALAQQHPGRIRWVSEPDGGPADAVNKAVAMARAPIIGWLNSDDLYTPGAAARAVTALQRHADWVMVYGEGDHVDLQGAHLGRYPTRGPDTPLAAWADGCHICQPTAFFRRDVFLALGGLDTGLRTAFDYEFWLRLLKAHPGRVGLLPDVQALSRLHDAGITLRMREQVALEGLQVVHRHIGPAPLHWLVTHVGEALSACPFEADVAAVRAHLQALADRAAPWLAPGGADALRRQMATHRSWQLARPGFVADVMADGWAPPDLQIRLRQPAQPHRRLRLWARHVAPGGGPLRLTADCSGTGLDPEAVPAWQGGSSRPGPFEMLIPLPPGSGGLDLSLHLRCTTPPFIPAQTQAGSSDTRRLAFQLDAAELL